jgi:hypothetical protein
MPQSIDWPRMGPSQPRRRRFVLILVVLAVIFFFGARAALSYYVDVLWFRSLGYGDVFWKTLNLRWEVFTVFAAATFIILYGSFLALKRAHLSDLPDGHTTIIGGQQVKLPVEPVLRLIALGVSLAIAAASGAAMMTEWTTLALFWYAPSNTATVVDPIFGNPQLAAYTSCDYLCAGGSLYSYRGRSANARRESQSSCYVALARGLDRACVSVARNYREKPASFAYLGTRRTDISLQLGLRGGEGGILLPPCIKRYHWYQGKSTGTAPNTRSSVFLIAKKTPENDGVRVFLCPLNHLSGFFVVILIFIEGLRILDCDKMPVERLQVTRDLFSYHFWRIGPTCDLRESLGRP